MLVGGTDKRHDNEMTNGLRILRKMWLHLSTRFSGTMTRQTLCSSSIIIMFNLKIKMLESLYAMLMQPYIMHHISLRNNRSTLFKFLLAQYLLVIYTHHLSWHLSNKSHYAYRENDTNDRITIVMTNLLSSTTQAISH